MSPGRLACQPRFRSFDRKRLLSFQNEIRQT
jgi:hypothetical protein